MHPGELLREEILPALGRPRVEVSGVCFSAERLHKPANQFAGCESLCENLV
jgi:hypothetical protein